MQQIIKTLLKKIFNKIKQIIINYKKKKFLIKLNCISSQKNILLKNNFLIFSGKKFYQLFLSKEKNTLIGISSDKKILLKIEIQPHPLKKNNLRQEAYIISKLNEKKCFCCPKLFDFGQVDFSILSALIKNSDIFNSNKSTKLDYMLQEYIPTSSETNYSDIVFSILEQKNLGYYQCDIKPDNLRFNKKSGICYIIDYDQAQKLDEKIAELNAWKFIKWSEKNKDAKGKLRYLNNLSLAKIYPLFKEGAFNIAETALFKQQITTNTSDGLYHSLKAKDIFIEGMRDISDRKFILDQINFKKREKILDLGCNSGLLCDYLYDKNCSVTGFEMDNSLVVASNIIARINKRKINFKCFDIDNDEIKNEYDTIMLFSVLHHTKNLKNNSLKIANNCKRIIIECRLEENGEKPKNGKWEKTSSWKYKNINDLIKGLEKLFPHFILVKNYGIGGRSRYILEFKKNNLLLK